VTGLRPIHLGATVLGLGLLALGLATSPREASAQSRLPPISGQRTSDVLDRLHQSVTRPLPRLTPAPVPHQDSAWVPDRYVRVPGAGEVHVPAHWQHRLPDGQLHAPPLVGTSETGAPVMFHGGPRAPVQTYQSP
jgi:hypothetical protein